MWYSPFYAFAHGVFSCAHTHTPLYPSNRSPTYLSFAHSPIALTAASLTFSLSFPVTFYPLTHPITILSLSALLSIFRSPSHPGNASYYFLGIPYGKARRFEASSAVDNLTDYPGQTLNAQQFGSCCWAPPEKVKESRQVELPCASTRCDICASTPFDYQAFCIEYVHLSRVPLTRT